MTIAASDLRKIKKAICDRLATVSGIGEIIPSRVTFADRSEFWATVAPKKTQKAIETEPVACASVHASSPKRRLDELNDKLFAIDYSVKLFREGFPARVDETATPDAFFRKLVESEDVFDAAAVNAGFAFREPFDVPDLSADLKATVLPMDTEGAETQFGTPEWFPTIDGHHIELRLTVEAIYDCC